jgi:hypothetical protein
MIQLTFSNGKRKVIAFGTFKEDALKKIFTRIDESHSNEKPHNLEGFKEVIKN